MQGTDSVFFEEYKSLDKLCRDMFQDSRGVGAYIDEMENLYSKGVFRVKGWDNDLKTLKHLRWVRNKIAHESGTFSTIEDLDSLRGFYNRIFSCQDSLALLRKALEAEASARSTQASQKVAENTPPAYQESNISDNRLLLFLLLFGAGVAIGIVLLIIISSFGRLW